MDYALSFSFCAFWFEVRGKGLHPVITNDSGHVLRSIGFYLLSFDCFSFGKTVARATESTLSVSGSTKTS